MYEYRVKKLYKVVDGDTIDVDIDLGFDISLFQRVRLAGIDTPESRTKDVYEKKLGLEVKEKLNDLRMVMVRVEAKVSRKIVIQVRVKCKITTHRSPLTLID